MNLVEKGGSMRDLSQIGMIDGKAVYRDCNGEICTETNDFRFLRGLTGEEETKLLQVLKTLAEKAKGTCL